MGPIYVDPPAWEAADLSWLAALSVLVLFILSITLLVLCTSCQRQRFELDHSARMERNSSSVVQVVPLEKVDGRDNPTMNYAERNITVLPEDLAAVLRPNQELRPWRNHTLERNPERHMNGTALTNP